MIKSDETSGSFSSSSASDTFPENNDHRESPSTLFSNLFADTETGNRDCKGRRLIAPVTGRSVADVSGIGRKTNSSNCEAIHEGSAKNRISDTRRTSTVSENCDTCGDEETALPPLSNDATVSDRNKLAPSLSCSSRVPVPVLPVPAPLPVSIRVPIPTLRTNDDVHSGEKVAAPEEMASGLDNGPKGIEACTPRHFRSSASRIPISTGRVNAQSQKRNLFFLSTRGCFQRLLIHESEPLRHKRPASAVTSNKYDHIKSKVAAYIHRPTKHESAAAAAAAAANKRNTTRSMSPNDSRMRSDTYASGDGMRRLMSSRASLETYTCENKMASADISMDLEKFEIVADCDQKIRKHIELALEHNRRKLEQERIIAGHHRDIAKQHQLILEHGERAHDCLQKAMLLLLDKK